MNQSPITITIREEDLPDNATVLLHMGGHDSRALGQKTATIVKYHDHWIGLFDQAGRFAISVYALAEIEEGDVLSRMRHTEFGRSTVGDVRGAGFDMIPTTVSPLFDRGAASLQPFHYSIMLPVAGREVRLREDEGHLIAESERAVRPQVERVVRLFQPMSREER